MGAGTARGMTAAGVYLELRELTLNGLHVRRAGDWQRNDWSELT